MNRKQLWTKESSTKNSTSKENNSRKRPYWVDSPEDELCPECFKVVGVKNRYKLVCLLGRYSDGMKVGDITASLDLQQPTITHHLNVLRSVNAVRSISNGRERVYKLNRKAHCFDECNIPFQK